MAAVYLLLGAEPIQVTINKRMLSLFGQIIRDQNSMENKIAYRQIAIYEIRFTRSVPSSSESSKKTGMENYGRQESESILDRLSVRG
jgi:hypothetical protein